MINNDGPNLKIYVRETSPYKPRVYGEEECPINQGGILRQHDIQEHKVAFDAMFEIHIRGGLFEVFMLCGNERFNSQTIYQTDNYG